MKALFKTLFGSTRTVAVGALALALAILVLRSPAPFLAGIILPVCLLCGAFHLARH